MVGCGRAISNQSWMNSVGANGDGFHSSCSEPQHSQRCCTPPAVRTPRLPWLSACSSGIHQPPPTCYGARLRVGAFAGSLTHTLLASVWIAVRYAWLLAPRCSEPAADTGTTRNEHDRRD